MYFPLQSFGDFSGKLLITSLSFVFFVSHIHASTLYLHPSDPTCGGNSPCYTSWTDAQLAAVSGDKIILLDGTYASTSGHSILEITKSLIIEGQSQAGVILNAANASSSGIWVEAPNVSISNLTVQNAPSYGILNKMGQADGLSLSNISVLNGSKSGIGLRAIDNVNLSNLTLSNNVGNGLSLTSATQVTIDGLSTSGNQFQAVNGFTAAIGIFSTKEDGSSSQITLQGAISIAEPVCLYLQPGPLDTANILTNPPVTITQITVPISAPAVVGVDVPIILNQPAQPNVDFGGVMGSDAVYYFKDMETASDCAEAAAREYDGLLEPYIFLYNRLTGERTYLPQVTLNPASATYSGSASVEFNSRIGGKAVGAEGTWQISKNSGNTWEYLEEKAPYVGTRSASLTVSPVSLTMDDHRFRFIAKNEWGSDTSQVATLGVPDELLTCTLAPVLNCPVDTLVETDRFLYPDLESFGRAEATASCAGQIDSLYFKDVDFRLEGAVEGDVLRTWYAIDELGNQDSCGQWISFTSSDQFTVSTQGNLPESTGFSLYPNPSKGSLYIQAPASLKGKHKVYVKDLLGRTIKEVTTLTDDQQLLLSTQDWKEGIYLIEVATENELSWSQKIVVQN